MVKIWPKIRGELVDSDKGSTQIYKLVFSFSYLKFKCFLLETLHPIRITQGATVGDSHIIFFLLCRSKKETKRMEEENAKGREKRVHIYRPEITPPPGKSSFPTKPTYLSPFARPPHLPPPWTCTLAAPCLFPFCSSRGRQRRERRGTSILTAAQKEHPPS